MSSLIVNPLGTVTVTVPANGSIAVYTKGTATVSQVKTYSNYPSTQAVIGTVTAGQAVFGPYSAGATIVVEADAMRALYEFGSAPLVEDILAWQIQGAPIAVDATGAVSVAAMLGGIVTSSTAAAVAGTIPTGTALDAGANFAIGDSFDWSVINTGPNTFTVTAATGHTIVGVAAVVTVTSGSFRTRKTAAATYVTYRMS